MSNRHWHAGGWRRRYSRARRLLRGVYVGVAGVFTSRDVRVLTSIKPSTSALQPIRVDFSRVPRSAVVAGHDHVTQAAKMGASALLRHAARCADCAGLLSGGRVCRAGQSRLRMAAWVRRPGNRIEASSMRVWMPVVEEIYCRGMKNGCDRRHNRRLSHNPGSLSGLVRRSHPRTPTRLCPRS